MKNIDKIKAMTVDEMAEFLVEYIDCCKCPKMDSCLRGNGCFKSMNDWLESEV